MLPQLHRTLPLLCLAVLLSACSLFDGSSPQPAPTSAVAPPFTPTPLPPTPGPGDSVSISWTQKPTEPHEAEADRPFEELVKTNAAPGAVDRWRAYTVSGNGPPRLERETRRWVYGASWLDGGSALLLGYTTQYMPRQNPQARPRADDTWVRGVEKRTPGMSAPVWDLRLPDSVYPAGPRGDFAFVDGSGGFSGALVLRSDGTLWEMSGLRSPGIGAWSPDGNLIAFNDYNSNPPDSPDRHYVLQPLGREAVLAGEGEFSNWSPDSSSLAIVTNHIGNTDLLVFDISTRITRRSTVPGGPRSNYPRDWSNDGRFLALRDGLLDLQTRSLVRPPSDRGVIDVDLSPDGRWILVTTELQERTCPGTGLLNQTVLIDIASGAERLLFDCNRFWANVEWVDADSFIASTHTCWGCEGKTQLFLVSLDGSYQPLNDSFGFWIRYDISPDGSKILVSGDGLRVYDTSGVLLRRIPVEPGYEVTHVKWSPDGDSFVYIVGPKDFVVL